MGSTGQCHLFHFLFLSSLYPLPHSQQGGGRARRGQPSALARTQCGGGDSVASPRMEAQVPCSAVAQPAHTHAAPAVAKAP